MGEHDEQRLVEREGSFEHLQWLQQRIVEMIEEVGPVRAAARLAIDMDRLEQERMRDPLTSAFNRAFVGAHLTQELVQGGTVGLIMLDLDYFKSVNDDEPDHHDAGDRVLIQAIDLLREVSGTMGVVGRWGGEELVVAVSGLEMDEVVRMGIEIGENISADLARLAKLERARVTASVGVRLSKAGETAKDLISGADQLLFKAKEGGRARLVYEKGDGNLEVVKFG